MDATTSIPVLLVTANVGSIFEDPSEMLKVWTQEFLATVTRLDPKFIALHCQEVGGKNYENSMKHVEHFVKLLMTSNELRLFDKIRVYLDEDYSSAENFTALGNLYFIHESIDNALIWNFKDLKFVPVEGNEINSGNIEAVPTKEKAKFPQDFFPECKWSRKGFLRTRWSLNNTIIDLINIHLFHDASNFVAMESYPSVYCKNRRRALEHTLERFHNDNYGKVPYFLFGDFNFRTDTEGVIKKLTEGLTTTRLQNNKNTDHTKLQYATDDSQLVLTVGKKEFNHSDHQNVFLDPSPTWLKTFDKELDAFNQHLTEFPINFPPSYPFEEKISHGKTYMQTRCPAWCDRVLLSHTAKQLVNEERNIEYGLIGLDTCMGDHKPVYLRMEVLDNSGTVKCCNHAPFECLPATCQCCQSFASVTINVVDMSDYITNTRKSFTNIHHIDSKLLHEPITRDMLSHEPYTPESAESRSPMPEEKVIGEDGEEEEEEEEERQIRNEEKEENDEKYNLKKDEEEKDKFRRNSVSPKQLKSRLEDILKISKNKAKIITRSASENVDIISGSYDNNNFSKNDGGGDSFFRLRAMSELPKMKRVRLISTDSVNSIHRLQSHHSSSDEDWFEFDNDSNNSHDGPIRIDNDVFKDEAIEIFDHNESIHDDNENNTKISSNNNNNNRTKKFSCCCVT